MNCPGKAILLALSLVLLSRMQWANGHAAPFNQKAVQQERKNETEQEHPANNGMSVVGSVIDLGSFRYTRSIIGGRPGLSLLSLDAAVLAHSRLDDLRIAQPDGHQIPYLLEKADEPFSMDLPAIEKTEPPESSSFVGRNHGQNPLHRRSGAMPIRRRKHRSLSLPYRN
jgi:hypothetical protein